MEKEILENCIKESETINEVLTKLSRNNSSGGYKSFKKYIEKYKIDISHFLTPKQIIERQYKNGGLIKKKTSDIFVENSTTSRHCVKSRVISEKLIEYKCIFCENDGNWRGKKISLILDHKNGVNNDNRLENLRFVCPNCEATLITHCKGYKGYEIEEKKKKKYQYKPKIETRKVERPDINLLKKQVDSFGYVKTGKIYGVSDNSIRKWIKWGSNQS